MAVGRKTGGRVVGTPNRKTAEINDLLESLRCNPIEGMAQIAQDLKNSPELRGRMYAELAQYVYPKRKAIEHTGDFGVSIAETIRQNREQREHAERRETVS